MYNVFSIKIFYTYLISSFLLKRRTKEHKLSVSSFQDVSCCTVIAENFAMTTPEILAGQGFSRLLVPILSSFHKFFCTNLPFLLYASYELSNLFFNPSVDCYL